MNCKICGVYTSEVYLITVHNKLHGVIHNIPICILCDTQENVERLIHSISGMPKILISCISWDFVQSKRRTLFHNEM